MIGQRKSWSGPANPSGARFYAHRAATKMAVSAHVWGEDIVDKVAQITTTRGPHKFAEWEHCDAAWVAMIDTCAPYPYCSSRRPVEDLTRKDCVQDRATVQTVCTPSAKAQIRQDKVRDVGC